MGSKLFCSVPGTNVSISSDGWFLLANGRVTKGTRRASGYLGITYGNTTMYAHRAVYMAWVGPIPEGMEIDHINADRSDNRLENLRVVTKSGNMRNPHTRRANLRQLSGVRSKALASRRVSVAATEDDGTVVKLFASVTEAAREMKCSRSDIARVIAGTRAHAGGYKWKRYHK